MCNGENYDGEKRQSLVIEEELRDEATGEKTGGTKTYTQIPVQLDALFPWASRVGCKEPRGAEMRPLGCRVSSSSVDMAVITSGTDLSSWHLYFCLSLSVTILVPSAIV